MNGGLYGNDNFPRIPIRDSSVQQDWLTITQIRANQTAANYIGKFAMQAGFSALKTQHRICVSRKPGVARAGIDEDYILEHFYFNSVLSDSGLTGVSSSECIEPLRQQVVLSDLFR